MRKVVYWVLLGVVVFMILQDPSDTGNLFSAFFDLLGDGFEAFFEFLDALFDGSAEDNGPIRITPTTEATPFDPNG